MSETPIGSVVIPVSSLPGAVAEPTAALLRRAADRLAELDAAATPAPWAAFGEWITTLTDSCTCASPGWPYPHEHGCGYEQLTQAPAPDAALIVALRGLAGPLAAWLRAEARGSERTGGADFQAVAVARAILGASS